MSAEPRFENYRFEIRPLSNEEGGGFLVTVPDLPGCMSDGDTYEEAIANARDAFDAWMETYREEGREIPQPGSEGKAAKLVLRLPRTLHQRVTAAAAAEGVSANTLIATFVAEGVALRAPQGTVAEPRIAYQLTQPRVVPTETTLKTYFIASSTGYESNATTATAGATTNVTNLPEHKTKRRVIA